jgi:MFS family permease
LVMIIPRGVPQSEVDRAARRGVAVLIGAQVVGGLGLASGVAVGALVAADLFADPSMSGVPFAVSIAGTAIATIPVFEYMRRAGRRRGLRLAWLVGALGAALVAVSAVTRSIPLMILGMGLFGVAATGNDAARFAAADMSVRRGRAIGIVVFATTFTAIVGPNLMGPAASAAAAVDVARTSGPFILSAVVFAAAALVLHRFLRPDPLAIRARLDASTPDEPGQFQSSLEAAPRLQGAESHRGRGVGVATMAIVNFAMVFAMTAAPAELNSAGHGLTIIGLVVSIHITAMFAPSALSGWLCDRVGAKAVIFVASIALMISGLFIASSEPGASPGHGHLLEPSILTIGLILLGAGWNFGYVAGSTLLGVGASADTQVHDQGVAEVVRAIAALGGALAAGIVLAGYGLVGIGAVTIASAVPVLIIAKPPRHRRSMVDELARA